MKKMICLWHKQVIFLYYINMENKFTNNSGHAVTTSQNKNGIGNPYHDENGEFTSAENSRASRGDFDTRENIEQRQNRETYRNYQKTIRVIANYTYYEANENAKRKALDIFCFAPAFEDMFLTNIIESIPDALGLNDYTIIENDEDDKRGVDAVIYRKDGKMDLVDVKCSTKSNFFGGKLKLRLMKTYTTEGGLSQMGEDWLLNDKLKTTHYAFCNYDVKKIKKWMIIEFVKMKNNMFMNP